MLGPELEYIRRAAHLQTVDCSIYTYVISSLSYGECIICIQTAYRPN